MSRPRGSRAPEKFLGQTFGMLTPVEYGGNSQWVCKCSCGGITKTTGYALLHGQTQSCGCARGRLRVKSGDARRELRELTVTLLRHRHLVALPSAEEAPELANWMDRAVAAARALREPV